MKTQLHHFAYKIQPNTLETVIKLLEKLGCKVSYRKGQERWCMISQDKNIIQLIETEDTPINIETKTNTHIAFISQTPQEDIEKIKQWAKENNIEFRQGEWYEGAYWFDLPKMFSNFVIEIMDTKLL